MGSRSCRSLRNFKPALGSLETDGVVIDPPPSGASDLTIAKTHSPTSPSPEETVTYTVTVSNVGTGPSSGTVTVTETPPPGLTVTALSGTGWTCTVATRTCTRSDALAPGASYPPITVTTSVGAGAAPGTVTNTAVVSGGGDSNSTNNTATDPTIIAAPAPGMDLTITKRHSPQTVVPGQTFSYFITVSNVGSSPSSGAVTVTETPPAGLTVTALSGAGWTCTVATRTCTRSDALAPASSYPDIIGDDECRRRCGAWHGDEHRGRLRRRRPEQRQQHGDRSNSHHLSGQQDPTSRLRRRTSAGVVVPGQTITFTIRVTNVGNAPTSGTVTVTEAPPPGLTVTALSGTGWTCVVATRTCLRADALAPGASYPDITVTASCRTRRGGHARERSGGIRRRGFKPRQQHGYKSDRSQSPGSWKRPHAGEDAQPRAASSAGATRHLHRQGDERRRLADKRYRHRDGDAAGGPDRYRALWLRLDLHRRHADVHSRGCARPGGELPRHHGDGEYRRRCAGHGREQCGGIRRRGFERRQQHGLQAPITISPLPVPILPVLFVIGLMGALLAIALSALRARREESHTSALRRANMIRLVMFIAPGAHYACSGL